MAKKTSKKKVAPKKPATPKITPKEKLAAKKAKAAERLEANKAKKDKSNFGARVKYMLFMDEQTGIIQDWSMKGHGVAVTCNPEANNYTVNKKPMKTSKQVVAAVAEVLFGDSKALDKKPKKEKK